MYTLNDLDHCFNKVAICKYFVVIYSFIAKDILFLLPISLINLSVDLLHLFALCSLLLFSTYLRYIEHFNTLK